MLSSSYFSTKLDKLYTQEKSGNPAMSIMDVTRRKEVAALNTSVFSQNSASDRVPLVQCSL